MKYLFTSKDINLTDEIKEKTKRKLDRIDKLFPGESEAHVTITVNKHITKMEVSIQLHKRILRAEVSETSVDSCLDSVVDILEKQTVKYKSRLRARSRRNAATREEMNYISEPEPKDENSGEIAIIKTKRFALKPMDAQEAVMEMELLGHNFYVFRNSAGDEVNVVYKRNDGEYGLIEPLY